MNNVAKLREKRGLKQGELADLAGVKQPHISRLENGVEGVTLGVIIRVADALGVPVWQLFADQDGANERLLVDVFRQLPPERQAGWLDMARAIADQPKPTPENG